MRTPESLNLVAKFHELFNHPILESPQIPDDQRIQLRYNLIFEELQEFSAAAVSGDIVEVADALADLQYVLAGAILEFGLGNKFAEIFEEVQRSNMSKACATTEEAVETVRHYAKKDGYSMNELLIEEKGGLFFVYRAKDMKTLKSINYSPANIKKILE